MSVAEQALFLLDFLPSEEKRRKLENFISLDQAVNASLPGYTNTEIKASDPAPEKNHYSVATRMKLSNYETQAKAEALSNALRYLRASHVGNQKARIKRGS